MRLSLLSCFWWVAIFVLQSAYLQSEARSVLVFEETTGTLKNVGARISGQAVYLPVSFFEATLQLERKDLAPNLVGLCYGDLCIPLTAREFKGQEYVSARALSEALGGSYLWDAEARQLFLSLESRVSGEITSGPLDFVLPDLNGRSVHLSEFRGKKIVVFAWASW